VLKNALFWDVTQCGSCKYRRFGGTYCHHHKGEKNHLVFIRSVRRLLVTAIVVPSSQILATLMMKAPNFSETLAPTRTTRYNIPKDDILHSHRRENL
jgi:hypothetical protein